MFTVNIGPILSKCELSNIGLILRTICSQYCATYSSNIDPILFASRVEGTPYNSPTYMPVRVVV